MPAAEVRIASLGSGSKGNGTLVSFGDTLVLVDCGFTLKETWARFARLGLDPAQLDAILVTHEHSDHAGGVTRLAHRFNVPVYLSYGSLRSVSKLSRDLVRPFNGDDTFTIGGVEVRAVAVPHDAREPTQFVFSGLDRRIGVLSDIGHVTPHVLESYRGCTGLFMESNHDVEMLRCGGYPAHLKRRIASDLGHLSNTQAADFLRGVLHEGLKHVVVGHISEQNNSRECLNSAFNGLREAVPAFGVATQDGGFDWIELG